ncbi:MAG: hypothetical protein RIR96_1668, partial [Bacteroidota bacterium]
MNQSHYFYATIIKDEKNHFVF